MIDRTDLWVEHLVNASEVRSIFPRSGLALSGLQLLRLEYLPGNKLRITLLADGLPEDAPQRWRDRGATGVEICLDVGVSAMSVRVTKEFEEMPPLAVAIGPNQLRVFGKDSTDDFEVEVSTFFMRLEARPLAQDSARGF
jgi:hypothetical protein